MMGIRAERFEDLLAWQKSRILTREIYKVTTVGAFARDYGLSNQIQRAAVSVMSNIAEGFERGSLKEFSYFLIIAKASCGEVRSQLYIASDIGYIDQAQFDKLMSLAIEVTRIIRGLHASIEQKIIDRESK